MQLTFSNKHFIHFLTTLGLIAFITASSSGFAQNYSPGGDPNNCTSGQARINNTCMDVGTSSTNSYDPNSALNNTACNGEGQARIDNVCVQVRAATSVTPMFVPERIKIGAGASAYYLDPTTENSSWADCKSGIGTQDSTCVIPYKYGVAAGLASISGSLTKPNPVIGGTGTSLKWTTTNAVSVRITCTGVANYGPATVPVQGNPSGITLNSAVPGVVTCNFVALNSDNEPATSTATATFSPPVPPTITAAFTDPNPSAGFGMPGTSIYWTANAKTLSVICYNANPDGSSWTNATAVLSLSPGAAVFKAGSAKTVTCNFVATNDVGQTANASATANFYNPPPATANAWFDPPSITEGQSSTFHYSSANAVYMGIVCSGVGFSNIVEVAPNTDWYFFPFTYSTQGVQECQVNAKGVADDWSATVAQLYIYPAGGPAGGSPASVNALPNPTLTGNYCIDHPGDCGFPDSSPPSSTTGDDGDGDGGTAP